MRYLLGFFYFIICLSIHSQTNDKSVKRYIQGIVYDEATKETIPSASINLLSVPDSSIVKSVSTDKNGYFKMLIVPNTYILEISFLGYKPFFQNINISDKQQSFDVGNIYMKEDAILLNETVITAVVPDIVVKGDTIEYNAASYTSEESAMLQDMIKNIPGIEIDNNGNITANGKPIRKILVDGKEFFGNDMQMALHNLPANMIKKLQLYKEESETAKTTGFKDKNPEQVLNLVVKEELKQSILGDLRAGYGSNEKYSNKVTINYMRNNNQASLIGDMNNVNDNTYGMVGGNGTDKKIETGANLFIQSSPKIKIGGNLRYSGNENITETRTNTQTFLPSGDRFSKQNMSSSNKRNNFASGLTLQWAPDSLTTIFARSHANFNNSKTSQSSSNFSFVAEKDTTAGQSSSSSNGNGYNLNNYLSIGRKLDSKGRTLSFTINHAIRNDDNKGENYSLTNYSDINYTDKIIDQQTNTTSNSRSYNISLSYVEPISKDHSLQLMYSYNRNSSERNRDVRKNDGTGNYNLIDTAYSRNTINKYINQNISLNFQTTKEKYNYIIGFSVDPTSSYSRISIGDSIIDEPKQKVVNFSPSINFSYNPNSNTSIGFNYAGSTSQPGISQISPDTTIVNALYKYYGNPNLKPSYNNNVNAFYQKSNYETSRFVMISGGFNYIFNNIVDYTLIDSLGNTINTYRNIGGNMGANINFMYDTPLKNKKFSFNNNTHLNFYKNIGFTNGEKLTTRNIVIGEQVMLKFKTKIIETSLQVGINYNIAHNNLTNTQNRNTQNYDIKHSISLKLPFDFSIQNNIQYAYYVGYGEDFKKSECLWNSSITKLFLRKKKGTLKLQLFDILNDRNNITRTVKSNFISDSRTNTVSRYFMLSFSYRFNIIRNKKSNDNTDDLGLYD